MVTRPDTNGGGRVRHASVQRPVGARQYPARAPRGPRPHRGHGLYRGPLAPQLPPERHGQLCGARAPEWPQPRQAHGRDDPPGRLCPADGERLPVLPEHDLHRHALVRRGHGRERRLQPREQHHRGSRRGLEPVLQSVRRGRPNGTPGGARPGGELVDRLGPGLRAGDDPMNALNAPRRDEHGFTLAELLITIAILGLVMAAVLGVQLTSSTMFLRGENQADAQQAARAALLREEDLRMVRSGCPDLGCPTPPPAGAQQAISVASTTSITFWADTLNASTTLAAAVTAPAVSVPVVDASGITVSDRIYVNNGSTWESTVVTGKAGNTLSVARSEEHTSELQSQSNLVCRLLLEKKQKLLLSEISAVQPDFRHSAAIITACFRFEARSPAGGTLVTSTCRGAARAALSLRPVAVNS